MTADIRVRRVYADPQPDDGARVLVDRVWPRGLRKDAARRCLAPWPLVSASSVPLSAVVAAAGWRWALMSLGGALAVGGRSLPGRCSRW